MMIQLYVEKAFDKNLLFFRIKVPKVLGMWVNISAQKVIYSLPTSGNILNRKLKEFSVIEEQDNDVHSLQTFSK